MTKCDIVYLAKGRPEFTRASLAALAENTNWNRVRGLIVYSDGEEFTCPANFGSPFFIDEEPRGGPVGVMNYHVKMTAEPLWCKLDNDVIVPPGWLDTCLATMDAHPELDLLGIEPPLSRTPAPWMAGKREPAPECDANLWASAKMPTYARCDSIGGIGLFRTRAWQGRPPMKPFATFGGFTDWQQRESGRVQMGKDNKTGTPLKIGWLVPPLKLFLLDRLPIEPWRTLSARYIEEKAQRYWTPYDVHTAKILAGWWLDAESPAGTNREKNLSRTE